MKILLKIEENFGHGTFSAKSWGDIKRCRYNFDSQETIKLLNIGDYILLEEHDGGEKLNCTSDNCLHRKGACSCEEIKCHEMSITKAKRISESEADIYISKFF